MRSIRRASRWSIVLWSGVLWSGIRRSCIRWSAIALLLIAPTAWAGNYFVSTAGNDLANGSAGSPWKTLQRAADLVTAGDIVNVLAGEYAGLDLFTSGTAANPITFRAQPGVSITSPNQRTPDGINLEGASYVVIEGFHVTGLPRAGIRAVGTSAANVSRFVTIRDNVADQNGRWGIFTGYSEDLLIENNQASRSELEHGIYVSNSADRPIVRDNLVWGNFGSGIQINSDGTLPGDGIIKDALVERNTVYGNGAGGGSALNMDGVQDSVFVNNLLYDNHASGISLYQIDGEEGAKNNQVLNNTILQPSDGGWAVNIQGGSTGNTVRNNILLNQQSFRGSISVSEDSLAGLSSDYNAVKDRFSVDDGESGVSLAQWRTATGQDAHSFVATLANLFVDPSNSDFHLRVGSLAVDTGNASLAPPIDLSGHARPQGLGFDMGAYEQLLGDVNYDGAVNIFDVNLVSSNWNETGPLGDANGDRAVNIFDINLISANWTSSARPVPEPGSAILAAIAAAAAVWARCRRGRR